VCVVFNKWNLIINNYWVTLYFTVSIVHLVSQCLYYIYTVYYI